LRKRDSEIGTMLLGKEVKKEDLVFSDPMNKKRASERYLVARWLGEEAMDKLLQNAGL
jgi:hypothetical protein